MNTIELLAPAGSLESLSAAVESGADAVYLGGTKFSARAFANNFDNDKLKDAVNYAHVRGVKVFVTINTLIADQEMQEAIEYLYFLYNSDVDAIIIQDFAILKIVQELFPDFDIHCSTQMTIHDIYGSLFYKRNGAKRVVLARELNLKQIGAITESVDIETEVFVHGALCVCYSGQCLMSSLIGGRSGNRGMCAQPCRRNYSLIEANNKDNEIIKDKFLLSTRDLNTFKRLEDIVKSNITSIKIEGRMKKPEYVAVVVNNYRRLINAIYKNEIYKDQEKSYKELASIFNREFTEGYLFENRNSDFVSIERPDKRGILIGRVLNKKGNFINVLIHEDSLNDGDGIEIIDDKGTSFGGIISGISKEGLKVESLLKGQMGEIYFKHPVQKGNLIYKTLDKVLYDKASNEYSKANSKVILITGKMFIRVDEYPIINVEDNKGNKVSIIGEEKVKKAEKTAITYERLKEQLFKTGDTPYKFNKLDIDILGDAFISVSTINTLRRKALEALTVKRSNYNNRETKKISNDVMNNLFQKPHENKSKKREYIAGVIDFEAAHGAIEAGINSIYILNSKNLKQIYDLCMKENVGCYLVLPSIINDSEKEKYEKILSEYIFSGVVISNIGQYEFLKRFDIKEVRGNYTLNVFNSLSTNFIYGLGIKNICLSPELNLSQIKNISNNTEAYIESVVYGYLPVMTSNYCPISIKNPKNCNGICNSGQYALKDHLGKLFRIIKTDVGCKTQILNSDLLFVADEINKICSNGVTSIRMDFYIESKVEAKNVVELYINGQEEIDFKERIDQIKSLGFTKGHFFRGVI